MSKKPHGQIRRSQVITTWGPGALLDLPRDSVIVGGLDTWPRPGDLVEVVEPRLAYKIWCMKRIDSARLYAPPVEATLPGETPRGIGVWRFPEWFVVQEEDRKESRQRSRRLVHRKALSEKGTFDGRRVVPTRFVRACPRGHIDDLDWYGFVHSFEGNCRRQLWLDERGTSGDLSDLIVRCECGRWRGMHEATEISSNPLGTCSGARPWLGRAYPEPCSHPSRLLIRTATNAYFPQVMSVLSLPDRGAAVRGSVMALWEDLQIVDSADELRVLKKKPRIAEKLAPFGDDEVLQAIHGTKIGKDETRPVKQVEVEALLAVPEGYGDDVPIDPNFHARRLPDAAWRRSSRSEGIECVIQVHRLREVLALTGFTRFEALMPDINGEFDSDVECAHLAVEPEWFPAVENRGEGVFLQLRADSVARWMDRPGVLRRVEQLANGHGRWATERKSKSPFPGGPYVLLHTLSHALLLSLSMRCGYPASSIRERVYVDASAERYGILLYTGSPDAEGTLGGLVQEARHMEAHLLYALRLAALCSNDPICAQHVPGESMEGRWLHGAACHGCTLVAETSCEMRNDYLDRALVVPVLGVPDSSFFDAVS